MKLITINEAARLKAVTRQAIHAAIVTGRLAYVEVPQKPIKMIEPKELAMFIPNKKRQENGRMRQASGRRKVAK